MEKPGEPVAERELSRLIGKRKEDTGPSVAKGPSDISETAVRKLEKGTILINTGMETDKDPSWAAKAEHTIVDVGFQEGRGKVYSLRSPAFARPIVKSERILLEEIARGKYRFKERV